MTESVVAAVPAAKVLRLRVPYDCDVAEDIAEKIIEGMGIREICDGKDGRPRSIATIYRWIKENQDFEGLYRWAMDWRIETMGEELLKIVDAAEPETVGVAKLKCHERRWLMSKRLPRVYGDMAKQILPPPAAPSDGSGAKVIDVAPAEPERSPLYAEAMAWRAASVAPPPK